MWKCVSAPPPFLYCAVLMGIAMVIISAPPSQQPPFPSHKPKYGHVHVCRARLRVVGWKRATRRGNGKRRNKCLIRERKRQKGTCEGRKLVNEKREREREGGDGLSGRGMSFPVISCNRTSGIKRGVCIRQSQWVCDTFPRPTEWTFLKNKTN